MGEFCNGESWIAKTLGEAFFMTNPRPNLTREYRRKDKRMRVCAKIGSAFSDECFEPVKGSTPAHTHAVVVGVEGLALDISGVEGTPMDRDGGFAGIFFERDGREQFEGPGFVEVVAGDVGVFV